MSSDETLRHTATLLPCPFCGGEPSSIAFGMSICDGHQIVCENKCAAGPFVDGKDEAEASKFWNNRINSHERLTARVAELEATIKNCALTGAICCDTHHQPALGSKVQKAIQSLIADEAKETLK